MTTENQILKKLKKDIGNVINFHKIETGNTERGVPDIFYRGFRFSGWIEIKQITNKKLKNIKIPFRPGQLNWLNFHRKLSLNAFLLLKLNNCFYVFNSFTERYNEFDSLKKSSLWYGKDFKSLEFVKTLMGSKFI